MINLPNNGDHNIESNSHANTDESVVKQEVDQEIVEKTYARIEKMFSAHNNNEIMQDFKEALIRLATEGQLCE